jgi:hypothetical protein
VFFRSKSDRHQKKLWPQTAKATRTSADKPLGFGHARL